MLERLRLEGQEREGLGRAIHQPRTPATRMQLGLLLVDDSLRMAAGPNVQTRMAQDLPLLMLPPSSHWVAAVRASRVQRARAPLRRRFQGQDQRSALFRPQRALCHFTTSHNSPQRLQRVRCDYLSVFHPSVPLVILLCVWGGGGVFRCSCCSSSNEAPYGKPGLSRVDPSTDEPAVSLHVSDQNSWCLWFVYDQGVLVRLLCLVFVNAMCLLVVGGTGSSHRCTRISVSKPPDLLLACGSRRWINFNQCHTLRRSALAARRISYLSNSRRLFVVF